MDACFELIVEYKGYPVELLITYYYPGCQAVVNTLPELCRPAEPPEVEFDFTTGNCLLDTLLEESEEAIAVITEIVLKRLSK